MLQQDAGQLSLRAFQIASPQSMDMPGGRKNAGRILSVRQYDVLFALRAKAAPWIDARDAP